MFKLLSEQARIKVYNEYYLRRLGIFVIGLNAVLFVGIVALVPAFVLSLSHLNVARSRTLALKNSPTQETSTELVKWLGDTNQKLNLLFPGINKDIPYVYFQKIIGVKPAGIKLQRFALKKEKKDIMISIQGSAEDRKALLDFENQLNASGSFGKAIIPVSNFAKDKDINFDLSLVISK